MEAKAAQARQVALAAGGTVVSESSSAVPDSSGGVDKQGSRSSLALAVPADTLDRVLDDLGKLGTTVQRSSSARDVTSTYVDTQSRVATMKAGLDQLRALLAKTADLNQIVSLETEISRRQADLDSLQAQLNTLDKKVSDVDGQPHARDRRQRRRARRGPVRRSSGGLKSGWKAFLAASAGVLTVLGAALPFLVLAASWRYRCCGGGDGARRPGRRTPGMRGGRRPMAGPVRVVDPADLAPVAPAVTAAPAVPAVTPATMAPMVQMAVRTLPQVLGYSQRSRPHPGPGRAPKHWMVDRSRSLTRAAGPDNESRRQWGGGSR